MARQTIREQLERIKKLRLKLDKRTGMLYSSKAEFKKKYKKVTLYALFISDERTLLLRPHVFEEKTGEGRTPAEWRAWFARHYNAQAANPNDPAGRPGVLYSILAGMNRRAGNGTKFWRLLRLVGWLPRVYLLTRDSRARDGGHKTKQTGRKNGQHNLRRGHGNASRKADDVSVLQRRKRPAKARKNRIRKRAKRHK